MKQLFVITLVLISLSGSSQKTLKDFFSSDEMVWFGVNFSEARMIGAFDQINGAGDANANAIKLKWIPNWNSLVINEPKNFKIKESFLKTNVFFELESNTKLNENIKTDKLMTLNSYSFSAAEKTVKGIVSKLNSTEKKEGIGVVFIVESFNKMADEAIIYVTVFDIKTKTVLLSQRMNGKPIGIGLRNFWAGSIKSILKQIEKTEYSNWKSKVK